MKGLAYYYFIPSVRQGLAAAIDTPATGEHAEVVINMSITSPGLTDGQINKNIFLYGPGDVLGFDPRIITRTDPVNNAYNFEANYFPAVEFADPDFLWRFTAANHDTNGNLSPWITLIVLLAEDRPDQTKLKEFTEGQKEKTDQVPWITVNTANLPDLNQSFRWCHVQVTAESIHAGDKEALTEELKRIERLEPQRTVSRLICPRRLRPGSKYNAFIVPTFMLGRKAGLPPHLQNKITGQPTALTPAWDVTVPEEIDLPYYYKWEFTTSNQGDFEQLIRLLKPRALSGLGMRKMDCENPGYGLSVDRQELASNDPDYHILSLEGALKSVDTEFTNWGKDPKYGTDGLPFSHPAAAFQRELADNLLNKPKADLTASEAQPVLAPPIYGRWHAARNQVDLQSNKWLDELNLDPRHRTAAGLGSEVVKKQQEALMASAWKQLGPIMEVNRLLRHAQFGYESTSVGNKRLDSLSTAAYLRITAPVHGQIRPDDKQKTIYQEFWESNIGLAPLDPAFRRISRKRGAIRKRQKPDGITRPDLLQRLNLKELEPAGPHPNPDGMIQIDEITTQLAEVSVNNPPKFISAPPFSGTSAFNYNINISDPDTGDNLTITAIQCPAWLSFRVLSRATAVLTGTPPTPANNYLEVFYIQLQVTDSGTPAKKAWQSFQIIVEVSAGPTNPTDPTNPDNPYGSDEPVVYNAPIPGDGGGGGYTTLSWRVAGLTQGSDQPEFRPQADFTMGNITKRIIDNLMNPADPAAEEPETVQTVSQALDEGLNTTAEIPVEKPMIDLTAMQNTLKKYLHPARTVVIRATKRIDLNDIPPRKDPLDLVMAAPEFPQPMYEALRDKSPALLLPGLESIPQNTLAVLETNQRFVESYLCGLNHEFASELLWREYPTDQRGSYFRQFWDMRGYVPGEDEIKFLLASYLGKCAVSSVSKLPEEHKDYILKKNQGKIGNISNLNATARDTLIEELIINEELAERLKDIIPLHRWKNNGLGSNGNQSRDNLVLLIKGDLLKKYPNTVIYAVIGQEDPTGIAAKIPALPEYTGGDPGLIKYPMFSGSLGSETTFLGFDITDDEARGMGANPYGWYFVIEERVSEARFGMDLNSGNLVTQLDSWDNLSWNHIPNNAANATQCIEYDNYINDKTPPAPINNEGLDWNSSSGDIARITLQKPVRIVIHAGKMIPDK